MITEEYKIRQLQSGKWVCEITTKYSFFGYIFKKSVFGFSGINTWKIGSIAYGRYCVTTKDDALYNLRILINRAGI